MSTQRKIKSYQTLIVILFLTFIIFVFLLNNIYAKDKEIEPKPLPFHPETYLIMGLKYANKGQYDEAIKIFQEIIEKSPNTEIAKSSQKFLDKVKLKKENQSKIMPSIKEEKNLSIEEIRANVNKLRQENLKKIKAKPQKKEAPVPNKDLKKRWKEKRK